MEANACDHDGSAAAAAAAADVDLLRSLFPRLLLRVA